MGNVYQAEKGCFGDLVYVREEKEDEIEDDSLTKDMNGWGKD